MGKPHDLHGKIYGFPVKCSLKPIHWIMKHLYSENPSMVKHTLETIRQSPIMFGYHLQIITHSWHWKPPSPSHIPPSSPKPKQFLQRETNVSTTISEALQGAPASHRGEHGEKWKDFTSPMIDLGKFDHDRTLSSRSLESWLDWEEIISKEMAEIFRLVTY